MRHKIALVAAVTGLGLTLALVLLLGGQSAPVARAASFTVDVLYDEFDGSCTPGDCSLREAIIDANFDAAADEITLGPGLHELTLAGTGENWCVTGDLDVTEALTITGQGPDQTIIDASGLFTYRVFDTRPGAGTVVISGVTVINGNISGLGGGIYNFSADLTLSNVDVISNAANGKGGGIYIQNGDVTLLNVDIISNSVEGGVYSLAGVAGSILRST